MRDRHSSSPGSSSPGSSSWSSSEKPRRVISGSGGEHKSSKKDDKPKRRSSGGQSPKRPPSPDNKGSSTPKARKREASSTERRKKVKVISKEKIAKLLGKYDGKSCLDAFLNKFSNCAKYGQWNEIDRQFYLTTALEGAAAQVLRDTQNSIADSASIILLLQDRFGTKNQNERFRAELHARRRKEGETLQELYQEIDRLFSLAYPGASGEMAGWVGRDAFLDSLEDQSLRSTLSLGISMQ